MVRQLLLGVVVFAATLLVLAGLTSVIGRSDATPSTSTAVVVSPAPTTTSVPVTSPAATPSQPTASAGRPSTSPQVPSSSPTPPAGDPVFVGAGDVAGCKYDDDEATAKLLDAIDGTVFAAGDTVYEKGTIKEFEDCYAPTWGRHLDRTWPVPGNHEWKTPDLAGYRAYFGAAASGEDGSTWYARDLGTWRVIMLDSSCDDVGGCGPDSPQGRWLAAELADSTATCTVAVFHVPRFSSGSVHGNDQGMDPFWQALYAGGVDVIINGHDHDYERFAPQDPDGNADSARGIREFVVGTGGRKLYEFGDIQPNSELRANIDFGVLALTLHDGSYEWRFQGATTDFADRGVGRCHA